MANTIDELNFEVILSDAKFDAKIKEVENKAKQFNTSLSNILNINKISTQMSQKDVENARRVWQAKVDEQRAQEKINREKVKTEGLQRKINAQIDRATKGYNQQSRILQELKGYALGYLSIHGATQLLSSLVRVTGEFELQKTTLAAMLGDLNKAEQVITRIQGLAVESPFQFKELTTYAKQLSAFSVPAQELYDTTKMLADISAGLGVGMDRIVLAYGQVRSAAFLRGQEVRQFTEAGIPILDELAKQFSELEGRAVSTGEVFDKISARLVPFEMVAKVMKDLTSEGGKFYNMQEVQAETLRGKISNLKDAYEVMLNEIGSAQSEKLKDGVDVVRKMMQNYEELGRTVKQCVITFGIAKTAIEVLSVATGNLAFKNIGLISSLRNVAAFAMKNPYVAMGAAITAIGVGMYKWVTALSDVEKIQKSVTDTNDKYTASLAQELGLLEEMYAKLELAKEGSLEYDKAKARIQSKYSSYIDELKQEGIAVDNLAEIYSNLAEKIQKSLMVRSRDEATQNLDAIYGEAVADTQNEFDKLLKQSQKTYKLSFSALDKESLRQFVFGGMDKDEVLSIASDDLKAYFEKIGESGTLYSLRENMKAALDAYLVGMDDVSAAYETLDEITAQKLEKMATGWRKTVQDTLTGMGLNKDHNFGLWATDTTQSTTYVEDMIKRYKELNEQIKLVKPFDEKQTKDLQQNKDAIEAVAKALKIDIKNLAANDSDTWESKEERRIKRLVEALRKLQDHYEKLKALGVSDDSIKKLFEGMFPELVEQQGKEFVTGLNYIDKAKTLIEELRKLNPEAADKVLVTLNADAASDYEKNLQKAIQVTQKYYESMRKLASEDFNLEGKGISLDISRVASELSSKTNEIDLNARKLKETLMNIDLRDVNVLSGVKDAFNKEFGEGSWDKFYAEYLSKGEQAINDFAAKQKEYEKKLAQEQINDFASKYVGEKIDGLNLTDWGDKSLAQIEYIRQRLIALMNEDINLPQSVIESISKLGLSTDVLSAKIKELFGERLQDATIEKFKELADMIGEVTAQASELGSQLIELGDTTDSEFLRSFGKSLQFVNELAGMLTECNSLMEAFAKNGEEAGKSITETAEGLEKATENGEDAGKEMENMAKSSDWVTMIIKLVVSLLGKVVDGINSSQQALHEAKLAAIEYANAVKEIDYDSMIASSETVFGTNEYKQYLDAMATATQYKQSILDLTKKIKTTEDDIANTEKGMSGWSTFSKGAWQMMDRIEDLGKGDILVDARNGWQKFWGTGNDLVKSVNIKDFIDEEGVLEGEKLRKWLKNNGENISSDNRKNLEKMLGDYDVYIKSIEDANSYLSSLFQDVSANMADAFINSFKTAGDAALDYADIMDGVATEVARSFIKSMIVDNVFTPEKIKEISSLLLTDQAGAMSAIDAAMQAAQDLAPYIQEFLKSMEPYFKMENEATSLGDGIKGITEDTANLLASYLNAIRADVSYARTIWERMDMTTQQIATMLAGFSAPSLMEYQMQIAANTYNTMLATQNIMDDLRSVITSEGGYTAIRTYS